MHRRMFDISKLRWIDRNGFEENRIRAVDQDEARASNHISRHDQQQSEALLHVKLYLQTGPRARENLYFSGLKTIG